MPGYQDYSDFDLLILLKNDDESAYLEIYDRYKALLQAHAYKKLGDMDEVKDVLQELFTFLWNKRHSIQIQSNLSAYLFTAVRNRVLNRFAKRRREAEYLDSLQDFIDKGEFITDMTVLENELARLIRKEIEELPPRMKEVFKLSRELGLSHKEIAAKLGTSEQTVSKQMTNALKVLRVRLGTLFILALTINL